METCHEDLIWLLCNSLSNNRMLDNKEIIELEEITGQKFLIPEHLFFKSKKFSLQKVITTH